ncbi:F0F1 ATP synthase subunit delta [Motilimonas sp. KMU-193]|uniref:F0F1 ATP synthase subunit delta n=1 Tax=Motilimonas sp. KMU-193 TaxID=3388668 RepID=UPI00396B2F67
MSELTTIARPYAKAAFDFAVEKGNTEAWAEMLFFAAEVAKNDSIAQLLHGDRAGAELTEIFVSICEGQLDENGLNLIKVMAENGRLSVLPLVNDMYLALVAEYNQEVEANVVSSVELTKDQEAKIVASLEKRLARKVKLNCSVDKSLIGGVVITAGDLVIDGSVRGKLNRLADSLQS